jgi:hypothetical protein
VIAAKKRITAKDDGRMVTMSGGTSFKVYIRKGW